MKTWIVDYVVGNTYKVKTVNAETAADAIKKARVKNIVDLNPVEVVEVFETPFGEVVCGRCGAELECDECGDMPEICPECGAFMSYEIYEEEHQ